MRILEATNTVLVAEVISRSFLELSLEKLDEAQRGAYERAVFLSKADDSDLCKKLKSEELDEYSILVATFKVVLSRVTELHKSLGDRIFGYKVCIPLFSNLIAWHQVLSTFRTLNV